MSDDRNAEIAVLTSLVQALLLRCSNGDATAALQVLEAERQDCLTTLTVYQPPDVSRARQTAQSIDSSVDKIFAALSASICATFPRI